MLDGQSLVNALLPYLERIIVNQAELKTALDGVSTSLAAFGATLDADVAQLNKALNEIVVALSNMGSTTPEVDAAVTALQAAAAALADKGTALQTVSQSLDDLNPDTPPAG